MASWSQSPFLQALGWAMLNSFWQMAVLFLWFSALQYFVRHSSIRKYYMALAGLGAGFCWFVYTFISYYQHGTASTLLTQHHWAPTSRSWSQILSSASLAYLLLLLLPAYRLFKNWRYVEHLKKLGLQKTAMEYRLFVKKVAQRLGIKHTVHVYLSHLVQSPVTIGYLKPIILLPLAAVNHLSPQQVEAVLLHELAHIRRHDYLINVIVTLLQTVFYYNPFVKLFVSQVQFERERCCDDLVLQFQYDKLSYASALLLLEKNVLAVGGLVLAAARKKHLLHRIEKIIGLEKRPRFTFHQFAGVLASFVAVLVINALLFVDKEVTAAKGQTFAAIESPFYYLDAPVVAQTFSKAHVPATSKIAAKPASKYIQKSSRIEAPETPITEAIVPVAYDATDEMVSPEEKAQIAQTLETTKKLLTESKWQEVEASIGDGMTATEKIKARKAYLAAVNKVQWKTLEKHLKTNYNELDWNKITGKLNGAIIQMQLDSLQTVYHQVLVQLQKAQVNSNHQIVQLPIPDASMRQINTLQEKLKSKIDSITILRERKVVNF